jgi:hypothetical protein
MSKALKHRGIPLMLGVSLKLALTIYLLQIKDINTNYSS